MAGAQQRAGGGAQGTGRAVGAGGKVKECSLFPCSGSPAASAGLLCEQPPERLDEGTGVGSVQVRWTGGASGGREGPVQATP